MVRKLFAAAVAAAVGVAALARPGDVKDTVKEPTMEAKSGGALDFTVKTIDGQEKKLSDYKGQVVLLVNVASKCGLTPQYKGLEATYDKYKDRGFTVLAFPANEFGRQEPGTNQEIKDFCKTRYDVTFPLFSKIVVKGEGIHPLYQFLTSPESSPRFAGEIPWNFTKFLVDRQGRIIARFAPKDEPESPKVTQAIEAALAEPK